MKSPFSTIATTLLATAFASTALAQSITTSNRTAVTTKSKSAWLNDAAEAGILFAQLKTYNDDAPASARIRVKPTNGAVRLRTQRSDYADATAEDIDTISFVGDPTALGLTGETGSFESSINSREQRFAVDFANSYDNPVMFVQVIYGGDPITAQPIFVESDGALVSVAEASAFDGVQAETIKVNWAVFEAGHYMLSDGRAVVVGAVDSTTNDYDMGGTAIEPHYEPDVGHEWHFDTSAAVFAQAQRTVGNAWQAVRLQRSTDTSVLLDWDPDTGTFSQEPVDYLARVDLRHTRDTTIENAEAPEPTVGPIGYLVIGSLTGTYELDISSADGSYEATNDTYTVGDGASTFDTALPRAALLALGGDPDISSGAFTVKSQQDALSLVRMRVIALTDLDGTFLADDDSDTLTVNAELDDALSLIQLDFSDGTSTFLQDVRLNRLTANDGALGWTSGTVSRDERFRVVENADGSVSLHTYYGHHLSVGADGTLSADATDVGDSEKFRIIDLSELAMAAAPNLRVQMADMDDDGEDEVVLFAEQDDGTGYLMLDPLGILDTMYKAGYEPDDDFVDQLSQTQRDALMNQLVGVDEIDSEDDLDGATLKNLVDALDAAATGRTYTSYPFEYVLDGALYDDEVSDGLFGATFTIGQYTVMLENDEFGPSFDLGATVYEVSGSIGGVLTGTVAAGSVYSTFDVNEKSFAMGAGAELISVSVMVGDEDGSYSSVSAGVGIGASVAAAWGENDQYGATIDLPIVPVAVAVYVKGEDVEQVAEDLAQLTIETYNDVRDFAEDAWDDASGWVDGAADEVSAAVENTWDDTRAAVNKAGGKAIAVAEEAGETVARWITNPEAELLNTLSDLRSALRDGVNAIGNAIRDFFSFNWI